MVQRFIFHVTIVIFLLLSAYTLTDCYIRRSSRIIHKKFKILSTEPHFINSKEWYSFGDCQVLIPEEKVPKSIVHFVGGFVAGNVVPIAYSGLLTSLSENGHMIVATPIPIFDTNHSRVADDISRAFYTCYQKEISSIVGPGITNVPIIGLSHSLGGKLMVLVNSIKKDRRKTPARAANVFLAMNNYGLMQSLELSKSQASQLSPELSKIIDAVQFPQVKQMIAAAQENNLVSKGAEFFQTFSKSEAWKSKTNDPFGVAGMVDGMIAPQLKRIQKIVEDVEDVSKSFSSAANSDSFSEFTPSPQETWDIIVGGYNVQRNVVIQFKDDTIDQSPELAMWLRRRGCDAEVQKLPGNHLTPNLNVDVAASQDTKNVAEQTMVQLLNSISNNAWGDINSWFEDSGFYLPPGE